jgi:hypothetical protein
MIIKKFYALYWLMSAMHTSEALAPVHLKFHPRRVRSEGRAQSTFIIKRSASSLMQVVQALC